MTIQTLTFVPSDQRCPFFPIPVAAGAPQPAEHHAEWINIDEYLRHGSDAVAYIKVSGDSMIGDGISDGDILVVHRRPDACTGDVVIAEINGEFTVKRLRTNHRGLYLVPSNDQYPECEIRREDTFAVWGIVKFVIHRF
ncbi:MAG: LexA family transcriptional regulator [Acidobacteriota bacterium]|nr:MAG: LexA family transcriptional regulator [Acidobacteriota bacterium]